MPPTRKGKKTRKAARRTPSQKGGAKALTIPELRTAFDALDQETRRILRDTTSADKQVKEFQAVWKRIFHRPVSTAAAEGYLAVKRAGHTPRSNTTRKQKGGAAALAGAPLDYMTRPGVDGAHVSVPQYVSGGLTFYNHINQDALLKDCGVVDTTPKVPLMIGSNEVMKGGYVSDFEMSRPAAATVPVNPLQAAQMFWAGKSLAGMSPDPSETKLGLK